MPAQSEPVFMTIDALLSEFEELLDWEERCDFLIDLGFNLPDFPTAAKTETNRVHGCQSNVWMLTHTQEVDGEQVIIIEADSDAIIVKGLIYILLTLFSGQTADAILQTDVRDVFHRIGLDKHLSVTRKNALNGMVQRIHDFAQHVRGETA